MRSTLSADLRRTFGDIDIYLFDQFLRGRFDRAERVLDAGCGDGRNLRYLLAQGVTCYGIDREPHAIARVTAVAQSLAATPPADGQFVAGEVDDLPWPDGSMDAVICSAVLHFAADLEHWTGMVDELWRVLAPGGLFFARLASNIGIEAAVGPAGRVVRLPDGSDRFVVDEALLLETAARLGARLADPIKTTNVQGLRCMTTWCLERPGRS